MTPRHTFENYKDSGISEVNNRTETLAYHHEPPKTLSVSRNYSELT